VSGGRKPADKGRRFELAVKHDLERALVGARVIRHGHAQRRAVKDGEELVPPDVQAKGILAAEVKHHHAYANLISELEVASGRVAGGEWPLAVVKADRKPAVAALYWEDLQELLGLWWREAGQKEHNGRYVGKGES